MLATLLSLTLSLAPGHGAPAALAEVALADPTRAELNRLAECMTIFRASAATAAEDDGAFARSAYVLAHTTAVGLAMARWDEDAAAASARVRGILRAQAGTPRPMILDEDDVAREPCLAMLLEERAALYREIAGARR